MRKLIIIILALFAFACDAPNQSSERGAGSEIEDKAPVDPADDESEDEASIDADTTASGDVNRQNQDTVR